jgi:hypothetical protein
MNEFFPKEKIELKLKIVEQGVLFLFHHSGGEAGDTIQVEQSWMSVHRLLSRLRQGRYYCAKDHPLVVWKQGEELHIKFYSEETGIAEEGVFSSEETRAILTMLEKLPSLN